jgi:hypothetical protein
MTDCPFCRIGRAIGARVLKDYEAPGHRLHIFCAAIADVIVADFGDEEEMQAAYQDAGDSIMRMVNYRVARLAGLGESEHQTRQ